jgi:arginine exporter protein ArgO
MTWLMRFFLQSLSAVLMIAAGIFAVAAFHDLPSKPEKLMLALGATVLCGILWTLTAIHAQLEKQTAEAESKLATQDSGLATNVASAPGSRSPR